MAFATQSAQYGARAPGRWVCSGVTAAFGRVARGLPASARGRFTRRRWKFHSSPAGLGQANGDGLPGRACAVLAFADVVYFFAHKFSGLSRRSFAFAFVFARPFECFFFRHDVPSRWLSCAGNAPVQG
jgi:hypothetical protein